MKSITSVSTMSIYMLVSIFGMLSMVTGAAIPNPVPTAVDGTGVAPGMYI